MIKIGVDGTCWHRSRPGGRSSAARPPWRSSPGAIAWPLAVPLAILAAFFLFFFRDPDRHHTASADERHLAGRRPRAGRGRRGGRGGAGRSLEAGQHFSVADGRARQPHSGVGSRHASVVHARAVSRRRTATMRRRRTSAVKSGSITAARWSWRVRSSAFWRDASCAASTPAPRCAPATATAS